MNSEQNIIDAIQLDFRETCGSASLKTQNIVNAIVKHLRNSDPSSEFLSLSQEYRKQLNRNVECSSSQQFAQRIQSAEKRREGVYFLEDSWGKLVKHWLDENANEAPVVASLDYIYSIAPSGKPTKKWISELTELFSKYSEYQVLNVIRSQIALLVESKDILSKGICVDNERKLKIMASILAIRKNEKDAQILNKLALTCYTKIPNHGPISIGVGNICLQSLSELDGHQGLVYLSELARTIKYPTSAADFANKRLAAAANGRGLSMKDLENMIVPDYGLKD